jgi:hypothetical protein
MIPEDFRRGRCYGSEQVQKLKVHFRDKKKKHMKRWVWMVFSLSWISVVSCSNETGGGRLSDQTNAKDSVEISQERSGIEINRTLPFGCSALLSWKYPRFWAGDMEEYGQLKQPNGQEFENLHKCFADLNNNKTIAMDLDMVQVQHVKIGQDYKNTFYYDTIAQRCIDSLKWRLSDIGPYQCYYFFGQSQNGFGDYGTLLLLDPSLKSGKTMNIYYEVGAEQCVDYRYFVVEDRNVRIFEGSCYDDGCRLTERFIVEIQSGGQIVVNELEY